MPQLETSDYVTLIFIGLVGICAAAAIVYLLYKRWKDEDPFDGIF
jgi:Mg2+ and Co2+ transporter CorA